MSLKKTLLTVTFLFCFRTALPASEVPLGGFLPFVGFGMTDEFKTLDDLDLGETFFIADPSNTPGGTALGIGSPYYDLALLDTGAATHIITQDAFNGFDFVGANLTGTNTQRIGGATGLIDLDINDAAGIYVAGLGDRCTGCGTFTMNTSKLRGQTSVATLTAPEEWALPNIIGLPMADHHAIVVRNSDPQIFQHQGRTIRTPQVDYIDLGSGIEQMISRRTDLRIRPGLSFVQGPLYIFNLDLTDILSGDLELNFHDNPSSPTVVENGALFVEVDLKNAGLAMEGKEFLFDTGADLTVVSQLTAKRLGFDAVIDAPDFVLEVEGSSGVTSGVPGFYVDELNIDTVGGSFTLQNVPIAVLDVTNPNDPGNTIDGILGMHVFTGRDIVIDANPSVGQGGVGPSLYISDPVTDTHQWSTAAAAADWSTAGSWSSPGVPNTLWVAQVGNVSGSDRQATVSSDSTVFQLAVSGSASARMSVEIQSGATLTTFSEALIETGGEIHLDGGKLDAQVVNIQGGILSGSGEVFVGTGPIDGVVRNLLGRLEPDSEISITGDLSNLVDGTIAIDLFDGGNDLLAVSRNAFLSGTLEVSLLSSFEPTVGQTFTILTYGGTIDLSFSELLLPTGYDWDLSVDGPTMSLVLEMTAITGDFDGNGIVDAADLAMWEAGYGQPNGYTGADFLDWQRNFGLSLPLATATSVPEPGAALLAMICLAIGAASRKKRASALTL